MIHVSLELDFGSSVGDTHLLQITKGGAAHATGRLRLGDRILEVSMDPLITTS